MRRVRVCIVAALIAAGAAGAVMAALAVLTITRRPDSPTDALDPRADAEVPWWQDPIEGACPATHPVKANLRSGIYHDTDSPWYEATRPGRCYRDAAAARADGLRPPRS